MFLMFGSLAAAEDGESTRARARALFYTCMHVRVPRRAQPPFDNLLRIMRRILSALAHARAERRG
jgi:hypothetical protein